MSLSLTNPFRSSRSNVAGIALACGAFAIIGAVAWSVGRRLYQRPQWLTEEDAKRDKILKDSFPASDPPASQYFDIPVNRQ